MKKEKKKNYKRRTKVYKGVGGSVFGLSTLGSFVGYEVATDWSNFKTDLDNFMVIQPETMKLNLMIAFPMLVAILIYIILWRKKNKKKLEEDGNITFGILIAILVVYALYSIMEVTLVTLVGAFVGSIIDDKIFKPLSKGAYIKSLDDHELEMETKKERLRIKAREKAKGDDLSGTV